MSPPGDGSSLGDDALTSVAGMIMIGAVVVLFIAIVFVCLLHFFAKRARRRNAGLNPEVDEPPVVTPRKGLDPAIVRSLPVLVFELAEFKEGLECSVCLCELSDGEKARLLPNCNHGFHLDCIDMWFQTHSTCPLCRNFVAPGSESGAPGSGNSPFPTPAEERRWNFPTNVLVWGNQGGVNTYVIRLEEESSTSNAEENEAGNAATAGEVKSPATRFRSLKRLLSRERRVVAPCGPSGGDDVEQCLKEICNPERTSSILE